MKKETFIFFVILLFFSCNNKNKKSSEEYKFIEFFYTPMGTTTPRNVEPYEFENYFKDIISYKKTEDALFIKNFDSLLNRLIFIKNTKNNHFDTRICCIMHYCNNIKDTIYIGNTNCYVLHSKLATDNKELLFFIYKYLYKKELEYYNIDLDEK